MKQFFTYLKSKLTIFILLIIFSIIFAVTFYLYRLPVESVLYAFALCAFASIIYFSMLFWRYREKARLLEQLKDHITLELKNLPEPTDDVEEGYIQLIKTLFDEKCSLEYKSDKNTTELLDYYTMWVHQIKVPLTALKLLLQSNGENNMDISGELFKIERYVEMVLQYLRMESMSSDLVLMRYPLDNIVKQAVRNYSTLFIGQKISLDMQKLDCDVLTDEKWLVFALEQILSNALKYTRTGGTISIYMDSEKEKTLVIEDTGIGIAEEDLFRVFEKGFTGYNGRADKKSTGIGLYLCRRILTKLSHTITIQSQVGKGTTVRIDLKTVEMAFE